MINYIITSSLLVIPAWLAYRCLVQNRTSAKRQKGFLYVAVLGSLIFPLFVPGTIVQIKQPHPNVKAAAFGTVHEHQAIQQYCKCEAPNYAHRIKYRANVWYKILFENKIWLTYGIIIAMMIVLGVFLMQILYLKQLIGKSGKKEILIDGQMCYLLKTSTPHSVAAFWLGRPYIIWQEQLSSLSEKEQLAVYRHELSHLRQYNTLEKATLRLLQCLWGFNPVFYWIRRELDLLSEYLADESAASTFPKKQVYAHLLLQLQRLNTAPLSQAFHHSFLRKRIERLVQPPAQSGFPYWQFALGVILAIQIGGVLPLSAHVSSTLIRLETYEEIYHKVDPNTSEAFYCTDCETVCTPE